MELTYDIIKDLATEGLIIKYGEARGNAIAFIFFGKFGLLGLADVAILVSRANDSKNASGELPADMAANLVMDMVSELTVLALSKAGVTIFERFTNPLTFLNILFSPTKIGNGELPIELRPDLQDNPGQEQGGGQNEGGGQGKEGGQDEGGEQDEGDEQEGGGGQYEGSGQDEVGGQNEGGGQNEEGGQDEGGDGISIVDVDTETGERSPEYGDNDGGLEIEVNGDEGGGDEGGGDEGGGDEGGGDEGGGDEGGGDEGGGDEGGGDEGGGDGGWSYKQKRPRKK